MGFSSPLARLVTEPSALFRESERRPDDNTTAAVLRFQGRERLNYMLTDRVARWLPILGAAMTAAGIYAMDHNYEVVGKVGLVGGLSAMGFVALECGRGIRDVYRAHLAESHPDMCPVLGVQAPGRPPTSAE